MQRVVGIGGVFIKSKDPDALREWYRLRLGMDIQDWGGTVFRWQTPENPNPHGSTTWSVSEETSTYFEPSTAPFMVNYRVKDLDALLALLRAEGCDVDEKTEQSEYGKFGWVMDPDGNRVELWQPPPGPLPARSRPDRRASFAREHPEHVVRRRGVAAGRHAVARAALAQRT